MFERQYQLASLLVNELDCALRVIKGGDLTEEENEIIAKTFSGGFEQIYSTLSSLHALYHYEEAAKWRKRIQEL